MGFQRGTFGPARCQESVNANAKRSGRSLPSFLYLSSLPTHFLHATFARRRRDVVRADSEINLSGATAAISFNLTASEIRSLSSSSWVRDEVGPRLYDVA